MSEMVERVARALYFSYHPGAPSDIWEEVQPLYRLLCIDSARASIAAMREPTPEMFIATGDALVPSGDAAACWKAMIDEALRE